MRQFEKAWDSLMRSLTENKLSLILVKETNFRIPVCTKSAVVYNERQRYMTFCKQ